MEALTTAATTSLQGPKGNQLPEDPDEFAKAIAPCRIMVRPILSGISRLCSTIEVSPLDKEEIDSGAIAFGALMYQYGAMLDARVLVALWLCGVSIPRAVEYFEKRDKKREVLSPNMNAQERVAA